MFRLVFRRQSGERFDCTDYSLKVADSKMRSDLWNDKKWMWLAVEDLLPHVPARALQLKTPRLIYRLIFLYMQTCRHV